VPALIAILGSLALAALWLLFPQRFHPSDPWVYSLNAWEISRGPWDFLANAPNHPFSHRLAVTVPVAALYKLFGVSLWTTNLWPLLCACLTLAALCAALRTNGERALAALLWVTCVGVFRQTTVLFPDLVAATFLFGAAVLLFHRERFTRGASLAAAAPTFALLVFIAFLAKETAYWILPVWIFALVSDLRPDARPVRLRLRFHLLAVTASAMLGTAYLVFCARVWGDPLARLASVQALTGRHLWSWQEAGAWDWFKRLALSPPKILALEFGPVCLLAVIALIAARREPRRHRFWLVYSGSMILLFWFGSTDFSRYEPLPAIPRMLLPAIPGLIVIAASLASRLHGPGASNFLRGAVAASILPFVVDAFAWNFSPDPRIRVATLVRAETTAESRVLLLTADIRSAEHLAFYFGYRIPANLALIPLDEAFRQREPPVCTKAFLYSEPALSAMLHERLGMANHEGSIDALDLLFELSDPPAVLEALRAAR
jgi:hypothetical protein